MEDVIGEVVDAGSRAVGLGLLEALRADLGHVLPSVEAWVNRHFPAARPALEVVEAAVLPNVRPAPASVIELPPDGQ